VGQALPQEVGAKKMYIIKLPPSPASREVGQGDEAVRAGRLIKKYFNGISLNY
jgi:hypothetical protein